jgi:hypothetical protein
MQGYPTWMQKMVEDATGMVQKQNDPLLHLETRKCFLDLFRTLIKYREVTPYVVSISHLAWALHNPTHLGG